MIEQIFATLLKSSPSVSAIVQDRVYGLLLPTTCPMPAIDFKVVSAVASPTFDSPGSQRFRFEVNCWADRYDTAVSLRSAVIASISGYYDGKISIQFHSSQDLFEFQLSHMRAVAEFYAYTSNF